MKTSIILLATTLCALNLFAQSTAFTYQGRLNANGGPANGTYDLTFTIFASANGLNDSFANQTNLATSISNGLFTATIDSGPGIFTGPDRWLEITVRTNGGSTYTALSPRQKITATPYAITAGNVSGSVSASQLSGSIAPANIGAGTITSAMLAAGSVTTSNLANGAVTLAKLNTSPVWTSSATFTNPTPAIGDSFGTALAAFGTDRVIVGAQWDDPGVVGAGAAYLFSTNGTLLTAITNPFPVQEDLFGIAVSGAGGDKLVIGAYLKDVAGATNTGAAYLFNTNGTLLATFTNPTPALDDNFGWAVAGVGTDKVVIAANNDSTGATNAGAAYVYSLNGTLLVTITNPTPAVGDQFGYQLAAVGTDKILISSVANDTGGTNAGAAYLFSTNGALLTTFTNPMPVQSVFFGLRIAAAGNDRVLISGALSDFTTGVAFLYSINGTLLATFGPAPLIGASLAFLSPDKVAIGAAGDGAGSVHLFTTNGAPLATIANPNPVNGAYFGYSLAAIGDRLLIGVPQDNTGASGAGVAHLFGIGAQYIPGLVGDGSFAANPGNIAIDSSRIVDGTIAEVDLADGAVSDAKISNVDASKLTGTVQDVLLSPNVALLNANQTFTGQNTFNNPANAFTGNGSALSALNASQLMSGTVGDARLSANVPLLNGNQTFTAANTFNNAGNNFTGAFTGNGAGLSNVVASTLGGFSSSNFWKTGGNSETTPGADFLGTTDNQPLTLRVNNTVALQFRPGATVPNVVGGLAAFRPSVIANGVSGAVIVGGNAPSGGVNGQGGGDFHAVYDNDGTVGGGFGNKAGSNNGDITDGAFATVAGGVFNSAANYAATVAGGDGNFAAGQRSFIGGGFANQARADFSTAGGGLLNSISDNADYAIIGGGDNNSIGSFCTYGTISGGSRNVILSDAIALPGSTVSGGTSNSIRSFDATIGGGLQNTIEPGGYRGTIGGGEHNTVQYDAGDSTIAGGFYNTIGTNAGLATIGGGGNNRILPLGQGGTIPGGYLNSAASFAFAAGFRAKANHPGSFVWADSQNADFSSTANNQFNIRAQGGVQLNTDTSVFFGNQTRQMLNLWGTQYGIGVQSSAAYFRTDQEFMWYRRGSHSDTFGDPGAGGTQLMRLGINGELIIAGTLSQGSDRNIKQDFTPLDTQEVLRKVAKLPIRSWAYTNDPGCRHVGPIAQDFHAAFGLNGNDDKHITTVDADGVALAAIQGLNEKVELRGKKSEDRIQVLEAENAELKQRLEKLEHLMENAANR